ncbi:MAG TPA: SMI1/KNR4 family protein [Polyangiaceae bacterium]|nr:SMI1/KNR4 family protein [Polyangiaceae bacterium]
MRRALKRELDRLFAIRERQGAPLTRRDGASDEDLSGAEARCGVRFDEDFRDLYRFSNGGAYLDIWFAAITDQLRPFRFYSLPDLCQVLGWTTESGCIPGSDNGGVPRDPRIRPLDRHTLWVPFADYGNGDAILYFDADPTSEGTYGQIISFQGEPESIRWCARDLATFLRESNDLLSRHGARLLR